MEGKDGVYLSFFFIFLHVFPIFFTITMLEYSNERMAAIVAEEVLQIWMDFQ
jgi:hypothetical protein